MAIMRKILQPLYVKKFQCVGSTCDASCCIGWGVPIDQETYEYYRNCEDEQLRPQFDHKVTCNSTNANPANYAQMVLNEDGSCPFIDAESLCAIQRKMGENYLSVTCTTYPRITNTINGTAERSLTMSCPEAARKALLNTAGMQFEKIEEAMTVRCNSVLALNTEDGNMTAKRYFWELRMLIIALLQYRAYPLWKRLVILGLFCNKLSELDAAGEVDEIPTLIGMYQNRLDQNIFGSGLDAIPKQLTIQMVLMKELADERTKMQDFNSQRLAECFTEFEQGIQYTAEAMKEEIAVRYAEAHDKYYQPFMQQHEYILENYLVNFVFKNLFPINGEKVIFDNYVLLIIHYSMIKMLLIGIAGYHKENFGTKQVIKLIQSFAKGIEHSGEYLKHLQELFKKNGMNNLAYMTILIKN